MAADERFFGPILSSAECEAVFAGSDEAKRMSLVRKYIFDVRSKWSNEEEYGKLRSILTEYIRPERQPRSIQGLLRRLLQGFMDYADTDFARSSKAAPEQYGALELYCSDTGYQCIYSLISRALRIDNVSTELLITAVTLVEFLTIDLYNLRLSNIGEPTYSNYQGITYRGLRVTSKALQDYRNVTRHLDLAKRNFAIPLGLTSSTTDAKVMEEFSQTTDEHPGMHIMHWTIHIHGIDQDLLEEYLKKYPDSIVTSICAMPVARLSSFGEKEILLRGAFFHTISMESKVINGRDVHRLVVVMINANRDHITELGSNEGEKKLQREAFNRIVMASKYEVCASLAAQYSVVDGEGYKKLHQAKLDEIRRVDGVNVARNTCLVDARSQEKPIWLGGSLFSSYPRHYADLRHQWQDSIVQGRWSEAEKVLRKEYDWRRRDWYSVAKLTDGKNPIAREGYTLLHELSTRSSPNQTNALDMVAWNRLTENLEDPHIWKTLRTFDAEAKTAQELAEEHGQPELAARLEPQIKHRVLARIINQLEVKLHERMRDIAGNFVNEHAFRMPQLAILTEMEKPELWIPIPHMYGGFGIELKGLKLSVKVFETVTGRTRPKETQFVLTADSGISDSSNTLS